MATGNITRSDLNKLHGIIQNSMISHPKEIILASLRDFFQHDSYYHYVKDAWGFANTTDNTDLPLDAGLNDNISTRLFIGENYRFNSIFYPAILIKHGGSRYVPISINRDTAKIEYQFRIFEDENGNQTALPTPKCFVFNGAWEGSIIIDVLTRSLTSRDELVQLISIYFTQIGFESLRKAGVVVKPLNVSAPSEIDDRNDKLFRQSITLDIRSEWEVQQPIGNIVEIINFVMEFGRTDNEDIPVAPNLTIRTQVSIIDTMLNI